MPFPAITSPPPLSIPEGLPLLMRDLIHERIGMFFDASRLDLMLDKIAPLARARLCQSFMDYYYILKYGADEQAEWNRVMDALSVQETYFWREMDQVRALTNVLIPRWFSTRLQPLTIWSAACASGEEPYTIAMALIEAGHGRQPIDIVASDASQAALDKARTGLFRERSFRTLPSELQEKYFRKEAGGWRISPEIIQRVQFRRVNLVVKEDVTRQAGVPIIFCRNVFIYFTPEVIRRTVQFMAERMPDGGHLFIGSSESLLKMNTDFDLQQINDAFVYIRNPRATADGKAPSP